MKSERVVELRQWEYDELKEELVHLRNRLSELNNLQDRIEALHTKIKQLRKELS